MKTKRERTGEKGQEGREENVLGGSEENVLGT